MSTGRRRSSSSAVVEPGQVDLDALRALVDGRWVEVRNRARELADDPLFRPVFDLPREEYREHVAAQVRALAATGLPRLGLPESVGGRNDVGASVIAFEMLAFGDLSLLVKAGVQWGLFAGAILHLGTERHHERFLADAASFDLPGCFAMTETGHGSDVAAIRTTATYDRDADEFVISTPERSAYKDYIGNAARDGLAAVVFAQLQIPGSDDAPDDSAGQSPKHESFGVHAFVVPIRGADGQPCPGVHIEDCGPKGGLNGVDNGRLAFTDVRVPRDALLNRYGDVAADGTYTTPIASTNARFFTMLGTLIQGRISVAGGAGSAAQAALAIAIRYGERRRQFASPGSAEEVVLLDYRSHQRRLLPLLATSYALRFTQEELVTTLHEIFTGVGASDEARRELEARAAGVKAVATWHATTAIQTAREACGGAGYLAENLLPGLKADTDIFTTFEGDNTVLLQLVAKELLTNYRSSFGELDTLGVVRFAGRQVLSTFVERTAARTLVQRLLAAAPGRDEDADLLDRSHQLELFEWRERHVLNGLARRLRRVRPTGPGAFAGFNDAQDHVIQAARVHVDRVVLGAFVAAVDRCPEGPTRTLVGSLCDLYALSTLEADKGWFLEHGRLSARRAKTLTRTVNELCAQLRPHALVLVDGLGIPAHAIDVPLLSS
jgi:acyl-CoA oxidase